MAGLSDEITWSLPKSDGSLDETLIDSLFGVAAAAFPGEPDRQVEVVVLAVNAGLDALGLLDRIESKSVV